MQLSQTFHNCHAAAMRRENGHGLELQITCGLNLAWAYTFSFHMPNITDRYKSQIKVADFRIHIWYLAETIIFTAVTHRSESWTLRERGRKQN
jgi:hypothetical protein